MLADWSEQERKSHKLSLYDNSAVLQDDKTCSDCRPCPVKAAENAGKQMPQAVRTVNCDLQSA